jgi:hypothetical protein
MVFKKGDERTIEISRKAGKASALKSPANFKNMDKEALRKFNSEMGKRSVAARRKRKAESTKGE